MLEQINLDQSLSEAEYKRRLPQLQVRVYDLEHAIFRANIPVAIVFEGWAAAGKGSTINVLAERMDPRGFRVVPITPPRTAETRYPWLWRYWLKTPAYGQIVVYDTSWYRRVLVERVEGFCSEAAWQRAYGEINQFERQLLDAEHGTILFKFWMHISQAEQLKRFKERERTNYKSWKLTDEDWRNRGKRADYEQATEDMLLKTSTHKAPGRSWRPTTNSTRVSRC